MQHSKAPWKYDNAGVITAADGKIIVDAFWDKKMSMSEGNNNLTLMAAAPELLEALIAVLPHAEVIINPNHPAWKKAAQAIKKATGEIISYQATSLTPSPDDDPLISDRSF